MRILFIGDIIGHLGRQIVKELLPGLKKEQQIDLTIANAENAASGYGLTEKVYHELLDECQIDVLTSGNHIWDKKEFINLLKDKDKTPQLIRPANYPLRAPGQDRLIVETREGKIAILNLLGRTFMPPMDCPFQTAEKILDEISSITKNILIDVHAEASSEKSALAWFLDGRVSAVIGTHTHVQTADEQIFPQGTAFITDVGMVGSKDSIIGMQKEEIIERFLSQIPVKFTVMKKGRRLFNAVVIDIDAKSGKANQIERINISLPAKEENK